MSEDRKSDVGNRKSEVGDLKQAPVAFETPGASAASPASDFRRPISDLQRALHALATVTDPELPFLTIADMGILRDVREVSGAIEVDITPTYSGCPAMDTIRLEIELALARAGVTNVRVRSIISPAWTTDWLTDAAREKLRENGIAPPARAGGKRALFSVIEVACPHCGARDTERVSEFGSTACKAHYRCLTCREPFQYFKCI